MRPQVLFYLVFIFLFLFFSCSIARETSRLHRIVQVQFQVQPWRLGLIQNPKPNKHFSTLFHFINANGFVTRPPIQIPSPSHCLTPPLFPPPPSIPTLAAPPLRPPPPLNGAPRGATPAEVRRHRRARPATPNAAPLDLRSDFQRPRRVCGDRAQQLPRPIGVLHHSHRRAWKVRDQSHQGAVPVGRFGPRRQRGLPSVEAGGGVHHHRSHHWHRGPVRGVLAGFVQGRAFRRGGRDRETVHGGDQEGGVDE